jgi:uncharacterized coiled-coil DUF342 family protein
MRYTAFVRSEAKRILLAFASAVTPGLESAMAAESLALKDELRALRADARAIEEERDEVKQERDEILGYHAHAAAAYETAVAEIKALRGERDILLDEVVRLTEARDAARLAHQCSEGVLSMTVHRLEGIVEGAPTGRHNFLQRIDALREIEKQFAASACTPTKSAP